MNYNEKSIQTLKPLEGIRKKLGVYVGSRSNEAVHHIIKEIISNSIDEYLAGFGSSIFITINASLNSISVLDEGRGIPLEKIEDVFTKLHTSGKFEKQEGAAYGSSTGLNGIGLKICTATGRVDIEVARDNKVYQNYFHYEEKGTPKILSRPKIKPYTQIIWTPDDGVFDDRTIVESAVVDLCQELAYVTPNLNFIINDKIKIKAKSISDFITDYVTTENILSPIMSFKKNISSLSIEGAFCWTKKNTIEQSYANTVSTPCGGTHVTAFKTVLTREINKFLDSDLKGEEIRKGLVFILSIKTIEELVFKSQQKDAVNMPSINATLSALLKDEIVLLLEKNREFFTNLQKMIENSRKKEEALDQIREVLTKAKSKSNPIPHKLKPALNKQGAELFITEGK